MNVNATYILKSKNIFDSISDLPNSGGVVIEKNKIIGVFPEEYLSDYVGEDTKIIDYGDKLIMPGFIDSHLHMGQAMDFLDENYCIDIGSAATFPEIMKMMKEYGEKHSENPVIFGTNFNYFNLEDHFIPNRTVLDEYFPDKPILILTWEIHTFYANSKAIELSGLINDSDKLIDGIEVDENGEITGAFNDTAAFAIQKLVQRPAEQRKGSMVNFMNILNSYGITSVADLFPCGTEKPYILYKSMEDKLTLRIHFYPELLSSTEQDILYYKKTYNSPMLKFSGLKNLIDGVISVHTAWMSEPYFDDPSTCGYPAVSAEEVRRKMLEALGLGVNVRIHTIGDAAVTYVLDVFEEAEAKYGKSKLRNVMEHLEYVKDEDVKRLANLGIAADMQGRHITFYVDDGEPIMGDRIKLAFRWRDIYDAGAVIGTGSDYPVVHFSPARCIYAAVTRKLEDGHPEGGWLPEQRMTLSEMLKIYTWGSACALNREQDLGTLEPGKLADIVVLDRNLFDIPEKELLDFMPVMTMVDGNIVYKK